MTLLRALAALFSAPGLRVHLRPEGPPAGTRASSSPVNGSRVVCRPKGTAPVPTPLLDRVLPDLNPGYAGLWVKAGTAAARREAA